MSVYFIEYPIRKLNLVEIKLESDHCFSEFQRHLILSETEISKKRLLTLTIVEMGCTLLKFFIILSARSPTERPMAQDVYPFSLITS